MIYALKHTLCSLYRDHHFWESRCDKAQHIQDEVCIHRMFGLFETLFLVLCLATCTKQIERVQKKRGNQPTKPGSGCQLEASIQLYSILGGLTVIIFIFTTQCRTYVPIRVLTICANLCIPTLLTGFEYLDKTLPPHKCVIVHEKQIKCI